MTKINPKDAIDLGAIKKNADERDAAEKAAADAAAQQKLRDDADRWFRAMNRAFKGIRPKDERRRNLMRRAREAS